MKAKLRARRASPPAWNTAEDLAAVRQALADRRAFRDRAAPIEVVQTHISVVFLTRNHVFKFKRAVNLGFLNFKTLQKRRHFCREEVRLNRRLASDVYLGVVPLYRDQGGGFSLQPPGRVVDYAVVMRRLPHRNMLDARLRRQQVAPKDLKRLADFIAKFHRKLGPARRFSQVGSLATWRRNWAENFRQTEPLIGITHSAETHRGIQSEVEAFLCSHARALHARVAGGFIRNGHGDLRCEHIELARPIRIIDCVEFTERFRYGDVANDLAFLLMDFCALGRPDLARILLDRYVEVTGDRAMLLLIPFYACYRAYVRAKVQGLRLLGTALSPRERTAVVRRAARFFALAQGFARQMRPPVLLLTAGLMGSGKSHLAQGIARVTGMTVIATDAVRKELAFGKGSERRRDRSGFGEGIYTPSWTDRTYAEMLRRAHVALAEGRSVILDASFSRQRHRDVAFRLAKQDGAEPWLAECRAPDAVILARLRKRVAQRGSISDGRPELYLEQKATFDPVPSAMAKRHIVVDTAHAKSASARYVLAYPGFAVPPSLFTFSK